MDFGGDPLQAITGVDEDGIQLTVMLQVNSGPTYCACLSQCGSPHSASFFMWGSRTGTSGNVLSNCCTLGVAVTSSGWRAAGDEPTSWDTPLLLEASRKTSSLFSLPFLLGV